MVTSNVDIPYDLHGESVLVRRPAIPLWWNDVSRPHVALVFVEASSRPIIRYYLSERGDGASFGKAPLNVLELDNLPEGAIIEVRFSAIMVNLYQLVMIDGVPCWHWIGRCRGLHDFDLDQVDWLSILSNNTFESPLMN
ncbi:MAG: hypothetical protein BAJATHORv1_20563 [Candidatus Thorarchaeota archaeon]|nr:MAG: hypothetical protein BAJATHORv1_20563 [Candidatus Thorarchaeota archaeon]